MQRPAANAPERTRAPPRPAGKALTRLRGPRRDCEGDPTATAAAHRPADATGPLQAAACGKRLDAERAFAAASDDHGRRPTQHGTVHCEAVQFQMNRHHCTADRASAGLAPAQHRPATPPSRPRPPPPRTRSAAHSGACPAAPARSSAVRRESSLSPALAARPSTAPPPT